MKIKHILTAQCLLLAAACLQLAAQTKINPAHSPDEASASISVPRPVAQARVQALRTQLEAWEKQLQMKSEMVEEARQDAVSAGIQGDGAGPYIDTYRQQQKEMTLLKVNLTPKIEEARNLIADLTRPEPPAAASASQSPTPARKRRSASGKKTTKPDSTHVASLGQ
jgi:hypothetical protein